MDASTSGIVTKRLFDLIAKQVDDHALVVWYDPEGNYRSFASSFSLPNNHRPLRRLLLPTST